MRSQAEPPRPEPISVRIPEAARLTGLSRSRLYELMKNGEVEYVKVGNSTLILVAGLRAFIEGKRGRGALDSPPPTVSPNSSPS